MQSFYSRIITLIIIIILHFRISSRKAGKKAFFLPAERGAIRIFPSKTISSFVSQIGDFFSLLLSAKWYCCCNFASSSSSPSEVSQSFSHARYARSLPPPLPPWQGVGIYLVKYCRLLVVQVVDRRRENVMISSFKTPWK